jgi:hypothetical protein
VHCGECLLKGLQESLPGIFTAFPPVNLNISTGFSQKIHKKRMMWYMGSQYTTIFCDVKKKAKGGKL